MNMTPERLTELHDWVFAADEDDIVQRIESAEAEVDRLRAQVARIDALHHPVTVAGHTVCDDDEQTWPCATRRAAPAS